MTIAEIAADFAALCAEGKFDEAGEKYWSPNIVSIEAMGPDPVSHGIEAARAKGVWWYENHEIHSAAATGPYVNGDQFIIRFKMDITFRETGARSQMDEDALYTVKDGKIVEERFFYGV
jgi:ketosteroid isomerase-like protein